MLNSNLSFTTAAISTDYFDFTFKRYGNIASIFFNKCKKDLPVNTPIVFDIPVGYRPCWMVTQMQSCGRQKLTTYYCSSSDGNAGIIIYDGLAKDIGIYPNIKCLSIGISGYKMARWKSRRLHLTTMLSSSSQPTVIGR